MECWREGCEKVFVFFFKQKTAYEIYQCDWSSDVCSSDLGEIVPKLALSANSVTRCLTSSVDVNARMALAIGGVR